MKRRSLRGRASPGKGFARRYAGREEKIRHNNTAFLVRVGHFRDILLWTKLRSFAIFLHMMTVTMVMKFILTEHTVEQS